MAYQYGSDREISGNFDSTYMQIVSRDDHEFFIKKEYCLVAPKFKELFSGAGENPKNEVSIPDDSVTVQHCCRYFAYKARYTNDISVTPNFIIDPRMLVPLFAASHYLNC
ncbi:hypothetical protein TNCV_1549291 [Trichonephila clavipes]|nr:hypothetical protein TNCV_1549291 [Trichonephila clavipes]